MAQRPHNHPSPNKFLWVIRLSVLWKAAALLGLLALLVLYGVV
ncbi:MAG TPA: hypothetical protein VGV64_02415 [Thermoplasmata archaeon]|nr:hypothetical protein [Thermoplasmata archaeon]